jgi:hypothetical protein
VLAAKTSAEDRAAWRERILAYRRDFPLLCREQLKVKTKPPRPRVVPLWPLLSPQRIFHAHAEAQYRETGGIIRMVTLKSRQQGCSTYWLGRLYGRASLHRYVNTFTSANDVATAQNLFRTVKLFYESVSPQIRPTTRYSTKEELVFENPDYPELGLRSSMMVETAKNIHIGVSRTLTCLHLSEVARYDKGLEAIGSILGSIPMAAGTVIIMESTAFISGSYFKDMCDRARRREGFWRFCFVPWFQSDEYRIPLLPGERLQLDAKEKWLVRTFQLSPSQIQWRRMKLAEYKGDEAMFMQDFPCTPEEAWISTGYSVFTAKMRQRLAQHITDPIRKCEIIPNKGVFDMEDGPLWIWHNPIPGVEYDIAADVALEEAEDDVSLGENVAKEEPPDYSTLQVIRRVTLEQVAEWKGRVHPMKLAELAAALGYYYNTAQIAPESRGIGVATSGHLSSVLGYPNIYRWRYRDKVGGGLTKYVGWDTSFKSKQYLIAFALSVVSSRSGDNPLIHSSRLLEEIQTFVRLGFGQYGASPGNYDDLVMGWLIALVISNDEDFSRYVEKEEAEEANRSDQFFEPGKAPRNPDVDPVYTDADADERRPFIGSEVDGW